MGKLCLSKVCRAFLLCGGLILTGCLSTDSEKPTFSFLMPSPITKNSVDESEVKAQEADSAVSQSSDAQASEIYEGSGKYISFSSAKPTRLIVKSKDGVLLNFRDVDIRVAVKAVLGDWMGVNYVLDPDVKGSITLTSSRELSPDDVLHTFETVLGSYGYAILREKDTLHVVNRSAAGERSNRLSIANTSSARNNLGYVTRIVPLKYASAIEVQKVVSAIAPQGKIAFVDTQRNLLILEGTTPEIKSMEEAISMFDVDWLAGLSYAVFRPRYVDSKTMATELEPIFNGADSPVKGLLKLIPIDRINALLVISHRPEYLSKVDDWITRLDKQVEHASRKVNIYFVQHAKATELAPLISQFYGGETTFAPTKSSEQEANNQPPQQNVNNKGTDQIQIAADEKNNALMIMATSEEYRDILETLKKLDVAPAQVLIEATIMEVSLTDELKYGVQWFFQSGDHKATLSEETDGAVSSLFPGFSYSVLSNDVQVAINALDSITDVKVLSSPKLMVLSNQTASLQVGDQVPITTQSAVSISDPDSPIVNSVQFRDTGVILEVTPRINRNGQLVLEVSQEVSDVVETTTSGIDSPTIQQRKIKSTVIVENGETVALGGLIKENINETSGGLPVLKDLPGIGILFGNESEKVRRTELLVFITPHIARDTNQTRKITKYLQDQLKTIDLLDEDTNLPN